MSNQYTNLPSTTINGDSLTVQAINTLYSTPLEINSNVLDAIKGFFTSRGFDSNSAEAVAIIIIKQAQKDNYNPLQIMDTLQGLNSVEISALVAEIINYNRFKTSLLGYAPPFATNPEIGRNILL
jgi:hypothetical protein